MNVWFRLLTVWAALHAAVITVRAHGPYDSSSQLLILDGALELNTTLGMAAAKQLLLNAGLSEAEAAGALASRGPSTRVDLSVELAARFFEISAGGQTLKAKRLQVITDGLETAFTATYAGSYSGDLEVRARYFDGIEGIKPGAFTAMDENHNVKAVALLSPAKRNAAIKLSAPVTLPPPTSVEVTNLGVPVLAVSNVVSADATSPAAPARNLPVLWWVAVLFGGVIVFILVRRLSRR
jgi:hypothetical protein